MMMQTLSVACRPPPGTNVFLPPATLPRRMPHPHFDRPAAIAAQNRRRSPVCAIGGRPGDRKEPRIDRSEHRFRLFIATSSVEVLRRPLESALNVAVAVVNEAATLDGPAIME